MASELDQLCINTIRTLSIDAVEKAKSGHPGLPLGAAAMGYVVWTKFLRHNPADPKWINRDRFVLSAGHGSALLYSLLHLTGYDLSLDEIKNFRQENSKTPGHPEAHLTPGVEATTGPLGQGVGNMVGMAIAREHLAAIFNTPDRDLINFRVFGICSDGDMMEGVASEAASLAGHLGLGCITLLYDDNNISIDGSTGITFTEDVSERFRAYDWHVLEVDGLSPDEVQAAVQAGINETKRPTLIRCRTIIGYGSPNKAGTAKAHGSPLGEDEVKLTKKSLGWPEDKQFYIPNEALKQFRLAVKRGSDWQMEWNQMVLTAKGTSEEFRERWDDFWSFRLPDDWKIKLPSWKGDDKPLATRKASEKVINSLAPLLPWMVGGSADLAESNLNYMEKAGDFSKEDHAGRNLHFGVREHGMGAILNGMVLTAPFIAHGATFLNFLDYMKPSVRLAALTGIPVIYVYTHDSIGLGEDGPTHQPVEHLWHMRATPNLWVMRPGDANETAQCWKLAIERRDGPTALCLTRQNLPVIDPERHRLLVERGAYILEDSEDGTPELIIIATGSEVPLALAAKKLLDTEGIATRVVSMPCTQLFDRQPESYHRSVLASDVKNRLAVEAGATLGWWKYVGEHGDVMGLDTFGISAPGNVAMKHFGFTVENLVDHARAMVERNRQLVDTAV
jgi:transketolase